MTKRSDGDENLRQAALNLLRQAAAGRTVYGPQPDMQALQAVEAMERQEAELEAAEARRRLDEEQQRGTLMLEHRRLDIEQQKVDVQKAEVIVRALEVGVQGGVEPGRLLEAIGTLADKLLPDGRELVAEALPAPEAALQLVDKDQS